MVTAANVCAGGRTALAAQAGFGSQFAPQQEAPSVAPSGQPPQRSGSFVPVPVEHVGAAHLDEKAAALPILAASCCGGNASLPSKTPGLLGNPAATIAPAPVPVSCVAGPAATTASALCSRLFLHLDVDRDGVLAPQEAQAAKEMLRSSGIGVGSMLASYIDVADIDRDGVVSSSDWQTHCSRCDFPPQICQALAELLQTLDSTPPGWRRLPMAGMPGKLGLYCQDLDLWATDAHLIGTLTSKRKLFDALLLKLGKMGKGYVQGAQLQAVCSALRSQGGVGNFLADHLQQADVQRAGSVNREGWIRHFINVNVSEEEIALLGDPIAKLDATELDELALAGAQGGLPPGWQQQESSSRQGVFYYVHSSLALTSRLKSMKQVLEVEQALGLFDKLLQVVAGGNTRESSFTPPLLSQASRFLPQVSSNGVMLMQILNTADLDRDGTVSRSDWANYFIQVGMPSNTLKELDASVTEMWRTHCVSTPSVAYASSRPAAVLPQQARAPSPAPLGATLAQTTAVLPPTRHEISPQGEGLNRLTGGSQFGMPSAAADPWGRTDSFGQQGSVRSASPGRTISALPTTQLAGDGHAPPEGPRFQPRYF